MKSFISQKNKVPKIYELVQNNKNQLNKLDNIELQKVSLNFNRRNKEIILTENLEVRQTGFYKQYQFDNLDSKYLYFLKPYVVFSTEDAYEFNKYSPFYFNYDWEEYNIPGTNGNSNNTIILTFKNVTGYIARVTESGGTIYINSTNYPIYATIKIQVLNSQLFKTFLNP